MINETRLALLQSVDLPAYVLESEAYIKRHRNWIFDSPISKIQRSKSMHRRSGSCSSFGSEFDTSSSSNSSLDMDDLPPRPSREVLYPRLEQPEGASAQVRDDLGLQYMQRLAESLCHVGGCQKRKVLEKNYEDFFEAFEQYSRQSSAPAKKAAEQSKE